MELNSIDNIVTNDINEVEPEQQKPKKKKKTLDEDNCELYFIIRSDLNRQVAKHNRDIQNLNKKIKDVDDKIYQKCKHEWETEIERYSSTQYVCSKCRMTNRYQ